MIRAGMAAYASPMPAPITMEAAMTCQTADVRKNGHRPSLTQLKKILNLLVGCTPLSAGSRSRVG
jgi:hypothetical protein